MVYEYRAQADSHALRTRSPLTLLAVPHDPHAYNLSECVSPAFHSQSCLPSRINKRAKHWPGSESLNERKWHREGIDLLSKIKMITSSA